MQTLTQCISTVNTKYALPHGQRCGYSTRGMEPLEAFIDELVRTRYGTAAAIAGRIGMSQSAFSRGISAGSLSTESLLRLALETGTPASDVLRKSKKEHVAHLIEQLYGKSAAAPPTGDVRTFADIWPTLPPNVQHALMTVLRQLGKQHAPAKRRTA